MEDLIISKPQTFTATIRGFGGILMNKMPDLSQTKSESKNQTREDPLEKERRAWREKLYFDGANQVFVPGENIHECMAEGAKYWGERVKGSKTYTDLIKSAIVPDNLYLGLDKDDPLIIPFGKAVNGNPSKGKKSGCKVYKIRPLINPWQGSFNFSCFDQRLTLNTLKVILTFAGTFKGLCDWRPVYGRFELIDIKEAS
jgi:hypothetical protein